MVKSLTTFRNPHANEIPRDHYILNHLITRIIVPRKTNNNHMNNEDLKLLWHAIKRKPHDLPKVVFREIVKAYKKKSRAQPYGRLITLIIARASVLLEGQFIKACKKHDKFDTYGNN